MKKISKELHKSYLGVISLFFISYIGLLYFFIDYINKDVSSDIVSIESFINYEINEFESKLANGRTWESLFYNALDECPKMPNVSVVFLHEGKIYSSNKSSAFNLLKDSEFSNDVQQKKIFIQKNERGKTDINFSKLILFTLPDYQFINKKVDIPNQGSIQILIYKKMSHEKKIMLRVFRFSALLITITTVLSILVSKKFYKSFTSSLTQLQEITNNINLENINKNISTENKFIEFNNITISYKKMLERLNEQSKAQVDFVNNASHELKTPIFIIKSYINMIKRWGFADKKLLEETLEVIGEETENMSNLVTKLLFLAKDDVNNIENSKIDLSSLLFEIRDSLKVIYPNQIINIDTQSCILYSDPYLLRQLILNIMENAIKYGENKNINIRGRVQQNFKLEIIDNGMGISKENLEHIFEKFFRVDKSRSRKLGSHGLGLSIVKKISNTLKIDVDIESEINVGTKVTLNIPIFSD